MKKLGNFQILDQLAIINYNSQSYCTYFIKCMRRDSEIDDEYIFTIIRLNRTIFNIIGIINRGTSILYLQVRVANV